MNSRSFRPINWVQWISLATALSVAILMPFLVIRIQNGHRETNATIRTLLCYFETRTLASPTLTVAERRQAIAIYREALTQIGEPDCSPPR